MLALLSVKALGIYLRAISVGITEDINISNVFQNYASKIPAWSTRDQAVKCAGLIRGLHPANERYRYKVTPFLIGWAQT